MGRLALLPSSDSHPLAGSSSIEPSYYDISLPSDETFFRHVALDFFRYPEVDLRANLDKHGYADLAVSDKGQNLRGVIAMFGHVSTASGVLSNAYWRSVLEAASEDSSRPRTFTHDKLRSLALDDKHFVEQVTREYRFKNIGEAKSYMRAGLLDTLENLVRANVFFQVSNWRCDYCGHLNSRTFDRMLIRNQCDICSTVHMAPIDVDWSFELNDFVHRSLKRHSGLPVLWTIGHLLDRLHRGSFWYLPEVDLYLRDDGHEKNEIDILCMANGKFHAIEVKRCASTFLNAPNAIDKFCGIVGRLRPNIAVLSFERYCISADDEEATRKRLLEAANQIRERIAPWTELEVLVAQDAPGFNDIPADLGWRGPRVMKLDFKRSE